MENLITIMVSMEIVQRPFRYLVILSLEIL